MSTHSRRKFFQFHNLIVPNKFQIQLFFIIDVLRVSSAYTYEVLEMYEISQLFALKDH